MIRNIITLIIIFIVSNGSSHKNNSDYRIELELPNLQQLQQYANVEIMNSMFVKVAEEKISSRSSTFSFQPETNDLLNTYITLKNSDGSLSPQVIKMKIFYRNSLIYKYWSYTAYISSEYFDVQTAKIPVEYR